MTQRRRITDTELIEFLARRRSTEREPVPPALWRAFWIAFWSMAPFWAILVWRWTR